MKAEKQHLVKKLSLMQRSFYSKGIQTESDKVDSNAWVENNIVIQSAWMKYPAWINNYDQSPYAPSTILPKKGTKVLTIIADKIKDEKAIFGFALKNHRIVEGTFAGMQVRKDNGSDNCRPYLYVKVIIGGYIHRKSADEVVIA